MNNGFKFVLAAAGAGLLWNFLNRKKTALQNIQLKNVDVAIDLKKTQNAGYIKLYYNLKLLLANVENASVKVRSIEAAFFINGIEFADINQTINLIIAPNQEKTINVAASVNTGNIIASIIDIISEGKAEISVKGTLLTDLGLIEFAEKKLI
jgi:hypothetical protein